MTAVSGYKGHRFELKGPPVGLVEQPQRQSGTYCPTGGPISQNDQILLGEKDHPVRLKELPGVENVSRHGEAR